MSTAEIVIERIERLARISAYTWNLTRRVFSPRQAEAEGLVLAWMEGAGLSARRDPAGNLVGRIEGSIPGGPAIVIGGHVDTRADASRHDGTLGVLMGIAAVERMVRQGTPLHYAVEVIAFVEDAASRFPVPRLGSRAVVGRIDPHMLDFDDDYGVTLRQAMEAHGLDPEGLTGARRSVGDVLAYVEVAAEAGPTLEQSGSPVGVVPALTASSVLRITLKGAAVDAATVPMAFRHDALAGMAECVLEAERIGPSRDRATVTVGRVDAQSVPVSVVTGSVTFAVIVQSSDDDGRHAIVAELVAAFDRIAGRRRLEIAIERGIDPDATRCDPGLVGLFQRAVEASGHPIVQLPHGITTDASNMSVVAPIGSVLLRCRGSVGWGSAGSVEPADVEVGLDVLTLVLGVLASGSDTAPAAILSGRRQSF
ncbi:hydantoinase/carbamoylase family amidase [Methylobacterium sp. HMF5984]|uniref:hydantoinase/carbamoylase family amidase n=1 Tax=Methylobacterium sp. HMF5984 TaxID=3367370 RepID=UPI003854BBFF